MTKRSGPTSGPTTSARPRLKAELETYIEATNVRRPTVGEPGRWIQMAAPFKVKAVATYNIRADGRVPVLDAAVLESGDYVLLTAQDDVAENGLYQLDVNLQLVRGAAPTVVEVEEGATLGETQWAWVPAEADGLDWASEIAEFGPR